jgi:hypothetical protein
LPVVLQDELQSIFAQERQILQQRIENLEAEKNSSQSAFDRYRDRARESLMKSANELHAAEAKIQTLRDQVKVIQTISITISHVT